MSHMRSVENHYLYLNSGDRLHVRFHRTHSWSKHSKLIMPGNVFWGWLNCCNSNHRLCPFYRHWPLGEVFQYTSPFVLCGHFLRSTMSTQFCRVVELMRSACCQTLRNRSCLRRAVLAPDSPSALCVPGIPGFQRRAYSLDSLSSGPGRPTFGSVSQQHCVERVPSSSALTHRNLSAVAVQVGSFLWLCQAWNTATEIRCILFELF